MKTLVKVIVLLVLFMTADAVFHAQTANPERLTVTWSDPSRPGLLKVNVFNGGITVRTYNGRDVIIESRTVERTDSRGRPRTRSGRTAPEAETAGLRRLDQSVSGLTVEEENNVMEIGTSVFNQSCCTELEIQVPARTNLNLTSMNGGSIIVEGAEGDIEVTNMNGAVSLTNVAGSVVAHSMNGKVTASLRQVTANKQMAFTSMNGAIDVTLPSNTKANLQMRTNHGEIYTDFEVQMRPSSKPTVQDTRKQGGRFQLEIDSTMSGAINGGGPEFDLRTFNGNIYIRKGK